MKRFLLWSLVVLLILLIAAWFGGRWILSTSVPEYSGEISVPAITAPVQITFDARGIPQVWAENDEDMYFALGWLHASERLFQMELVRRFMDGTLSEIFGMLAYPLDVQQRRLGFARKAQQDLPDLSPEVRRIIEKYTQGINAWIKHKRILPPEFFLLGLEPAEWSVEDCLGIAFYQTWFSHSLMARDRGYNRIITTVGEELNRALKQYKAWSPPTVHDSFIRNIFGGFQFPLRMSYASNSWVIAPQKSVSGKAIHASDPHLPVNQVPGFWYIVGLHSDEGTHVVGVTAPGVPVVVMGHNDSIAYAFTVSSVDVIDYYSYQRHPEDTLKVLSSQGYELLQVRYENIKIQGQSNPRQIAIYSTPVGPVIEMDSVSVLAIRWAGYDFNAAEMMTSALQLHTAGNFEQFRKAVTGFGALDANWTYSDITGNIGYQLGTPIPMRTYEETFLELPGEDSTRIWRKYYPLEETPHLLNPEEGWLATCNNQIVSDKWPYTIPGFYDPYRITRAHALLREKEQFSVEDMERMQLDRISGLALRWKGLLAEGARKIQRTDLAETIDQWDGNMNQDQEMAALFTYWWEFLGKVVFEDELGEEWNSGKYILEEVLSYPVNKVIDNHKTKDHVETVADLSAEALSYVLQHYGIKKYGEVNALHIDHPLSKIKILDVWLNLSRGPIPMGGDKGTLNATQNIFNPQSGMFECFVAPSMRYVLDWANVDDFTINGNLGQSGNPFSPHYDDFLEMMLRGERWNVPFSKERVFAQKSSLLTLLPEEQ